MCHSVQVIDLLFNYNKNNDDNNNTMPIHGRYMKLGQLAVKLFLRNGSTKKTIYKYKKFDLYSQPIHQYA